MQQKFSGVKTMNYEELFVGWQNPSTRNWHTVGRVEYNIASDSYRFSYTKGLLDCIDDFTLFSGMSKLSSVYYSKQAFPFIQNRLLPKRRPEYKEFKSWLVDDMAEMSPLQELSYSGGIKGTDNLEFFTVPKETEGVYKYRFFVRGIRHLGKETISRIKELEENETIYLMTDPQNIGDGNAVALRVDRPATLIGYCPKYFSDDFRKLLIDKTCVTTIKAKIAKINVSAPFQYRVAVDLVAEWPEGHKPFCNEQYNSLAEEIDLQKWMLESGL
jgi:hypothetical protein